MKVVVEDYLNRISKAETNRITEQLKGKYARLEINLRHPYGHSVLTPQG